MKTSLIILLILMLAFGAQAEGLGDTDVSLLAQSSGTAVTDEDTITALLTAHDWSTEGYTLRFMADGSIADPTGDVPLFSTYRVEDGVLYLSSDMLPDQAADVYRTADGLDLVFDPMTSEYAMITLTA